MYHSKNSNGKIRIGKNLFVWGFVLAAMTAIVVGDVEQGAVEAGGRENVSTAEVDAISGETIASVGGSIQSFKFEEENFGIRKALAMLGSMYQKNIVPSPNVDGVLAFRRLSNVTFEEAMDAILGESFKYEQRGNLIKVYTKEEYKKIREDPERMIYKVFTLYYITAEEAEKLIKHVISDVGKIGTSTPADKKKISAATGGSSSGGIETGSLGSGGGGDTMALHDTIVVRDYPEKIADVEEVLKKLDIRPRQVLVEATILSALLTEEMKLGIDWNTLNGVAIDSIANIGSGVADGIATGGFASAVLNGGLSAGITNDHVAAFIRALETVTDTTVLANPKILAVNKQKGRVQIGKTLGYRGSTTISQGGVATQGEVQFMDTGTVLVFRPYIGNDGYIRMDIYPQESSAELNVDKVPDKTTAEIETNIIVKDGETIVIGGLFRDVVVTSRSQIPLLGDLPIIGAAFRGTSDKIQRQEVIILLTPHIVEEPNETEGLGRADDIRRKRFGAKDELQGTGRGKLAEDHYAEAAKYYIEGDTAAALKELEYVLTLRPAYLEAIRLKEKIVRETGMDESEPIERIMIEDLEREDSVNWDRR